MFATYYPRAPRWLAALIAMLVLVWLLVKPNVTLQASLQVELIITLAFLVFALRQPWLRQYDWGLRLLAIGLLLPLLLFVITFAFTPATAVQYFAYEKLPRIVLFLTVGFWLGANARLIGRFWLAFAIGLLAVIWLLGWQAQFSLFQQGRRLDFDLVNAGHTAMFFGLALIAVLSAGWLLFGQSQSNERGKWWLWLQCCFALLLVVPLFIAFAATQTRAAFVALALVLTVAALHGLVVALRGRWLFGVVTLVLVVASAWLAFALVGDMFVARMTSESATMQAILAQDWQNIPFSSIGIRVRLWLAGLEAVTQSPLSGWGEGARLPLLAATDWLTDGYKQLFGHYHNGYLEFAVAFGLIGLAWLLWLHIWVLKRAFQLRHSSRQHYVVWCFTLYSIVFMAAVSAFESYWFYWTGSYAMAFYLAPAYSLHLADIYQRKVLQHEA